MEVRERIRPIKECPMINSICISALSNELWNENIEIWGKFWHLGRIF